MSTARIDGLDVGSSFGGARQSQTTSQPEGSSFGDVISSLTSNASQELRSAEHMAVAGLDGLVPAHQVATALMSAERSALTAISIRDKIVAAVQEISRMQI
jgi:flagellar hook-basal body complex protein FliE